MPRLRARTAMAPARASHSSAKPMTGTPYSTARADPYGDDAGRAAGAASARLPAAVADWPSGPSTRNRLGVTASGSGPTVTRRATTSGSTSSVASRLSPNSARQPNRRVCRA
ncbi:hypothetical protein GCM10027075_11030 [Streptomyces heilongjiangensis]